MKHAVRDQMQKLGLSQADVGAAIDRSQAWVHGYLLADTNKTLRRLYIQSPDDFAALIETLQLDRRSVLDALGITGALDNATAGPRVMVQGIPVFLEGTPRDSVAGGDGDGDGSEYLYVPLHTSGRHAALLCTSDACAPYLHPGEYAVVSLDASPSPGQMVAVGMNGRGLQVRRLVQVDPLILATPFHGDAVPTYERGPTDAVIYGPVVARVSYR